MIFTLFNLRFCFLITFKNSKKTILEPFTFVGCLIFYCVQLNTSLFWSVRQSFKKSSLCIFYVGEALYAEQMYLQMTSNMS